MAGMHDDMMYASTPEQDAQLNKVGMPVMILTASFDLGFNQDEARLTDNTLKLLQIFAKANNISLKDTYDFAKYPMIGLSTDKLDVTTLNGEWRSFLWTMNNPDGMPALEMSCTENLTHSLYPGYGTIAWNFMKNYFRNAETGKLVYNPNVD